MERLQHLETRGIHLIIYESPLEPKSADRYGATPTPHAKKVREKFVEACSKLRLRCYTMQFNLPRNVPWYDNMHPPSAILGPYLRTLIAENLRSFDNDI